MPSHWGRRLPFSSGELITPPQCLEFRLTKPVRVQKEQPSKTLQVSRLLLSISHLGKLRPTEALGPGLCVLWIWEGRLTHRRTDLLILSLHFFSTFPTREKMDRGGGGGQGKVLGPSSLEEPFLPGPFGTGKFLFVVRLPSGLRVTIGTKSPHCSELLEHLWDLGMCVLKLLSRGLGCGERAESKLPLPSGRSLLSGKPKVRQLSSVLFSRLSFSRGAHDRA